MDRQNQKKQINQNQVLKRDIIPRRYGGQEQQLHPAFLLKAFLLKITDSEQSFRKTAARLTILLIFSGSLFTGTSIRSITEVCYNVQTTIDAENNIPIDYKVTNQNDSKAMGNMVQRAKSILRTNDFTVLYDKGFHTGSELKTAQDLGIETIVAIPGTPSTSQAPDHDYNYEYFRYDTLADTYTCPQGQILRTNGSWYKELTSSGNVILFKQYKTSACKLCQVRSQCTRSKTARLIHRSEFADYYEANRRNILEKEQLYKRRQSIVEHPYGTLKRQWGFNYILTKKGISRASSDVGLMLIAYNLRRIVNIFTTDPLKEYLRILVSMFLDPFGIIFGQSTEKRSLILA